MNHLDENLSSILSSLIGTDAIETPNTNELPENSSFNDGRLDFNNLADCITGNDANLHQSNDENVKSLLETHLNEISQAESASIDESATENLDDVTPFDLDKPIESLLESETPHARFIAQDCSESLNSLSEKSTESDIICKNLSLIQSETQSISENVQPKLDPYVMKVSKDTVHLDFEQNTYPNQCTEASHVAEATVFNESNEIETSDPVPDIVESSKDTEHQSDAARNDIERDSLCEEEPGETIIADCIVSEHLSNVQRSKNECKKRRRILFYEDGESDNSELEKERERLFQSKSPTPTQTTSYHSTERDEAENHNNQSIDEHLNNSANERGDNCDDDDDYIRDPNEKPGPKSKKQSTHIHNALKVKALLESAIVIPARKKRKKKRVIDSDDDYSDTVLNQPIASVDDIGLITEDNNIQMPLNVSIETEQKGSVVYIKKEYEAEPIIDEKLKSKSGNSELDRTDESAKEPTFVKVEPFTRRTTQVKMEKFNSNNIRQYHKRKEMKDIFGMPLNA